MSNIFKLLCFLILSVWMIQSCTRDKSDDPQPNGTSVCDSIIICDTIILVWDSLLNKYVPDSINCKKFNICDTLTACDSATVKYSVDIAPIMSANCAISGCHGTGFAQGGVTLDTYEKVKAKADDGRLKARAIDNIPSPMPPSGPLSAADKTKIQNWIDQGACP